MTLEFVPSFSIAPSETAIMDSNGVINGATRPQSAPSSGNNSPLPPSAAAGATTPSKVAVQMQKMRDANNKYKNLLKMAKERIEQQEQELKTLKGEDVARHTG